jgi:cell division protein ZapA (FtsZ GTPase activity inhibitor)
MESKSIRVRIYGSEYPLRVDDQALTTRAAEHLDKMMHDLHAQIPDQPPVTLAVLSALNVSEELFHVNQDSQKLNQTVEQEVRSMTQLLERAMDGD